jgi:pilus assembly protein Flp/PilA
VLIVIPIWGAEHALRRESGQGMVEYALILALIALIAVVALGLLGGQVAAFFQQLRSLIP